MTFHEVFGMLWKIKIFFTLTNHNTAS